MIFRLVTVIFLSQITLFSCQFWILQKTACVKIYSFCMSAKHVSRHRCRRGKLIFGVLGVIFGVGMAVQVGKNFGFDVNAPFANVAPSPAPKFLAVHLDLKCHRSR